MKLETLRPWNATCSRLGTRDILLMWKQYDTLRRTILSPALCPRGSCCAHIVTSYYALLLRLQILSADMSFDGFTVGIGRE